MAPNQKVNLKDKIDDGEMDLSMCDLQDVPVKEIAAYKKVYSLDLSNNHLVQLPKNFPTLTNITKLDLSRNKLKILPDNFGDLIKLKHLDLYKNELQHLPVSFCNLKTLKWLDLKDNPLVPAIKDAAGQCLDSKQCQVCATNMINFYTQLKVKIDQEREVREKQRLRDKQANEAALKLKQQQEKKSKKKEKNKQSEPVAKPKELNVQKKTDDNQQVEVKHKTQKSSKLFSFLLFVVLLVSISLFLLTSIKFKETEFIDEAIRKYWSVFLEKVPPSIQHYGNQTGIFVNDFHQQVGKFVFQLRENEKFMYIVFKFKELYNSVIPTAK